MGDDKVQERMGSYGEPVARMRIIEEIAILLQALRDNGPRGEWPDGALWPYMMLVDKLTRAVINPEKRDNWVDIKGYAEIALMALDAGGKDDD